MDSLQEVRGTNPFQQQFLASKEGGTNPSQQQFLFLTHSHLINGLELHLHTILSTEDGWQWKASIK